MKTLFKRYSLDKSMRIYPGEKRSTERSLFMKRIYVFFISGFLLLVILNACGISKKTTNNNHDDSNSRQAVEQPKAEDDKKGQSSDNNDKETYKLQTEIGIYNGQVDPHTIEIETAEGPTAFQLSDSARADLAQLNESDEVIYTYYENDEQLIIEIIEEYWYHRDHHQDDDHMEKGLRYDSQEEQQG